MSKPRKAVTRTTYNELIIYPSWSGVDTMCTRVMQDLGISLFSRLLRRTGGNTTFEGWLGEGAACETTDG